ncbi:MAG: hypothetical protein FJ137_04830 [Deltaproteobacteria bacterium]|nr:hypothetical protein [Deltaproteobacteria bacterium]
MKIPIATPRFPAAPAAPAAAKASTKPATTATTTTDAPAADGKRFDAHSLPPPSQAVYQPQPGKKAALDLRAWQPSQLREAMLSDIGAVFDLLVKLPPAVTFFGGARIKPEDPYYKVGADIGALLASTGAPIRTGAGPGIMTAGPEGYKEALKETGRRDDGGAGKAMARGMPVDDALAFHPVVSGMTNAVGAASSIDATKTQGFRIKLPFEQDWSDAIDVGAEARLFPYRKLALYENCRGVAVFPGGYGTLDELFEIWALGEAGSFHKPKAAVGAGFWTPILEPLAKVAVAGQGGRDLIPAAEWAKLKVTDDPAELIGHFASATTTKVFEQPPMVRAAKLAREIDESIAVLDRLPPSVTFLGGRRLDDADPTLQAASTMAAALARDGIPLRVGSSGVVADAVCAGARTGDGNAQVQGILHGRLVDQQRSLPNLRVHQSVDDLVTHKEIVGRRSQAFVALPGGLNTLGEVFSVLTQIQTGHLPKIPVVLVGKDYWQPIFDALKKTMLAPERKTIAPEDLDLVTITDDPNEALAAMKGALRKPGEDAFVAVADAATPATPLFEGPRATMLSPPGRAMASWLQGAPRGDNAVLRDVAYDAAASRAVVVEQLPRAVVDVLQARGVDARHVAWALDHGVPPARVQELLSAGAGPQAFRFLWACAPVAAYRSVDETALGLARRWAPHAEVVFQRLVELSTSKHLTNPDGLKVWLEGLRASSQAGDVFAARLNDAWDLVSAGHRVAVEETAKGAADLIDLDEGVAYAFSRVTSMNVAAAVAHAARTLNGDGTRDRPGAPPGLTGVVHVDLRANAAAHALGDDALVALVKGVDTGVRVDRVQLLLDDRVVTVDAAARRRG